MSVLQKFLVRAMHHKDPLHCLHAFQTLMHSTYGNGGRAEAETMYS